MLLNVGTIFDFNETQRNPRNCKNENETRNRLETACKLSIYNLYSPIVWKIVVWRTRTDLGARDFAVSCAVVWNSLPTDLTLLSLTAATFAKHLLLFSPGFSASEDYLFCAIWMHALLLLLLLLLQLTADCTESKIITSILFNSTRRIYSNVCCHH